MPLLLFLFAGRRRPKDLFPVPVLALAPSDCPQIVRERGHIFLELLRLTPYPVVKSDPQFQYVVRDAFVPTDVTCNGVIAAWFNVCQKYPSLLRAREHRRTLGHSINHISREIWTKRNEIHNGLRIQEGRGLFYLLVLPRRYDSIFASGHANRSSKVYLLEGECIHQYLSKHFCLTLAPFTGQNQRKDANNQRNERSRSSRDGRDSSPVPSPDSSPSHLDHNTHSLALPWTRRHIATSPAQQKTQSTLATVKPPRNRRTRLREDV